MNYKSSTVTDSNKRGATADSNPFNYADMLDAQVRFLEGDLLTIVDATEADAEKREAMKSLVRKAVRERFNYMSGLVFEFKGDAVGNLQIVSTKN